MDRRGTGLEQGSLCVGLLAAGPGGRPRRKEGSQEGEGTEQEGTGLSWKEGGKEVSLPVWGSGLF